VELTVVSNPSCDIKCDVGYVSASGGVTCASGAINGVTPAETNLVCNEYTCSAITYPTTKMSGSCATTQLTSVSNPSCQLSCIPGYSGMTLDFECDSTGSLNLSPSVSNDYCTENRCAGYFFASGQTGYIFLFLCAISLTQHLSISLTLTHIYMYILFCSVFHNKPNKQTNTHTHTLVRLASLDLPLLTRPISDMERPDVQTVFDSTQILIRDVSSMIKAQVQS